MDFSTVEKPKILLKNKLAQELMEQKTIVIDGHVINLWTGHSRENITIQEHWNKIKSYASLNSGSEGTCGDVVLTGVMQVSRQEIAECAVSLGFRVHSGVSYKTDYLVFGSENVSPSKIALAIELNSKGANIQFVDELSFLQLISENLDFYADTSVSSGSLTETESIVLGNCDEIRCASKDVLKERSCIEIKSSVLCGKSIVISGTFVKYSREDIKSLIEQHGGKNVTSISSKTSFLLAGNNVGPEKLRRAHECDVKMVSELGFLEMIGEE